MVFSVNFKNFVYHRLVCDNVSLKEVNVFGLLDDWVISALAASSVKLHLNPRRIEFKALEFMARTVCCR